MAYLQRSLIAMTPDAIPRWQHFVREVLTPTDLLAGQRLGRVELLGWEHAGDHVHLSWRVADDAMTPNPDEQNTQAEAQGTAATKAPHPVRITLRPSDPSDGAYLRTSRWNVGYLGEGFEPIVGALIREIGRRVESLAEHRGWSAATLHERWFRRPSRDEFLEVSPGKKLCLRVTDYCDENCVFCNATEGNLNLVPSKTALRSILGRLPTGELAQVIFSGGEPTLVHGLPSYVQMVVEAGARQVIVQTNGVGLAAPEALEAYLPWREQLSFSFSLHAFEARLSNRMTGASFVPALPLAERFRLGLSADALARATDEEVTARSKLGANDTSRFDQKLLAIDRAVALGFNVTITCVITRLNVAQVATFAERCWQRWGARLEHVLFSYAMPRGNSWLNREHILRFRDLVEPLSRAFDTGRRTGLRVEVSQTSCIPPCLMPDYFDHYDNYGDFTGQTANSDRVKPAETCAGCAFDPFCAGVWKRYLDAFGAEELRPHPTLPEGVSLPDDFREATILDLEPSPVER